MILYNQSINLACRFSFLNSLISPLVSGVIAWAVTCVPLSRVFSVADECGTFEVGSLPTPERLQGRVLALPPSHNSGRC